MKKENSNNIYYAAYLIYSKIYQFQSNQFTNFLSNFVSFAVETGLKMV